MATNMRMRIAVGATVLGLGGLAGYALGSNDPQPAAAGRVTAQDPKPKIHTEVVHRTIHVRAKGGSREGAAGGSTGSAPVMNGGAAAVAPVSDASSYSAPSTGTSGGSSAAGSDDHHDHGSDDSEHESEAGDD